MSDIIMIQAHRLTKQFPARPSSPAVTALSSLNLTIKKGTLTALIGPDGAGKTTFMRLVCGLLQSDSGSLSVCGYDVQQSPQAVQDRIGYMPQKFGLYEDLSVMENLTLYADIHSVPPDLRQKHFRELLDLTGLSPFTARPAGKLSGGMKQKLGLACTLVSTPDLLLLDEPTVGVDPLSRRELWHILHTLSEEKSLTVLVNTSYIEEAEQCQYAYILHKGQLLADGTPESLLQYARGRCYAVRIPQGMPPRFIQSWLLDDRHVVMDAVPEGSQVRFTLSSLQLPNHLLLQDYLPGAVITPVLPRLEDSFMILLRKAGSTEEETPGMPSLPKVPPAISGDTIIEAHDIVRRFGSFIAVDHTSFSVHKGEIFGLLGPNGAGKSTTFRMLCGLLPVSSGTISVYGVNLRTARARARSYIGYVAQKFSLYSTLSVYENLCFFGRAYGLSAHKLQERIETVAGQFHLNNCLSMAAGSLPCGYKQRLSMAAALLHDPPILFLDEPTSGIDPLARRTFWRQITGLAARGTTIVVTTHFMEEAEYCDRIMIQDRGRLIAIGTPSAIRHQGGDSPTMNEAFIHIVETGRQKEDS